MPRVVLDGEPYHSHSARSPSVIDVVALRFVTVDSSELPKSPREAPVRLTVDLDFLLPAHIRLLSVYPLAIAAAFVYKGHVFMII